MQRGPNDSTSGILAPGGAPSPNTSVSITGVPALASSHPTGVAAEGGVASTAARKPPSEYPGIALIVGAGSRLGRAIALSLLRQGCTKFILTDPSASALNSTSGTLKQVAGLMDVYTTAFVLPGHYTDVDFAERLVQEVKKWFGRVDYAVNVWSDAPIASDDGAQASGRLSAVGDGMDLDTLQGEQAARSPGEWDTLARGLKGFYELSRRELGLMKAQQIRLREAYVGRKQRGSLVHVVPEVSAAVTKALHDTISSLTTTDATAYSEHLVRINAVLTGPMEDPEIPAEVRQMMAGRGGAAGRGLGGRLRTVEEVVDSVVWLLSEKSSFLHGQVLGR